MTLMGGINDAPADADVLAALLRDDHAHVACLAEVGQLLESGQ